MNTELPNYNNFYSFFTGPSRKKITDAFQQNGWTVKELRWHEFKIKNNLSELRLDENGNHVLLNGAVIFSPENIELLNKVFNSLTCDYRYEFYDENKNLILDNKRYIKY